jgi:hypothetical protein
MLKRALLFIIILISWLSAGVSAQSTDQLLSQLKSYIMSADAVGIASQTMNSVEITQFAEGRYYSKGQATLLLKGFFKDYPPHDFKFVASTKSSGSWFMEGLYTPKNSVDKLKIYIRLRVAQGTWKVREIHIEQANE